MNKKEATLIFFAIIIVLITLGISSYLLFDKKDVKNVDNTRKEKNKTEVKTVLTEEEKEDISIKTNEIISFGLNTTSKDSFSYLLSSYNLAEEKTFIDNIEDAKTYIILNGLYTSKKFTIMTDADYDKMPSKYNSYKAATDEMIDLSLVKARYMEVFGEDLKLNNLKGCPTFDYDNENDKFYSFAGCGGTLFSGVLVHRDSINKVDDKVEVELYIGTISPEFKGDNLYYNIYSGTYFHVADKVDETSFIETIESDNELEKYVKENYQKLSKFKMIFSKDKNGNYIYESLK